jgi:hypothetical protein
MISNELHGAYAPPAPSRAARSVAIASTAHFSGQIVVPDGATGRIVLAESHLEFSWIMSLLANPQVETIVEQVPFAYATINNTPQIVAERQSDGAQPLASDKDTDTLPDVAT